MTCHNVPRAFQHRDVNIGYRPMVATVPLNVWSKPGCGVVHATLIPGQGFATQSVRNPSCLPEPQPRGALKGLDGHYYVWGYKRAGCREGWVRADLLIPDTHAEKKRPLDGPAGCDFEVGRTLPTLGAKSGCGKPSTSRPRMRVAARDTYLRYSPHGTAFHYLHADDEVVVLIANGPQGFHFVEVARAAPDGSVRPGARGWVLASSLERKATA